MREIFGLSEKEQLGTPGIDSNLESQQSLPIANDHIMCSPGRSRERLLKYQGSGALEERSLRKRGPCQVSLESQKNKRLLFGPCQVK